MAFRDLAAVAAALHAFAAERDWDRFHTPRNLATALSVEASEALEHFAAGGKRVFFSRTPGKSEVYLPKPLPLRQP